MEHKFQDLRTFIGLNLKKDNINFIAQELDFEIRDGNHAVDYMVEKSKISQSDVTELKRLLLKIQRNDLVNEVENYEKTILSNPESSPLFLCFAPPPRPAPPKRVLMAAGYTINFWDNNTKLNIYFMNGSEKVQTKVMEYASQWTDYAKGITFQKTTDFRSEIRISFASGGSWSYVGKDCLGIPYQEPTMNLGWLTETTDEIEFRRVVLHEFGHALGLIHEHQSDKSTIEWDEKNVYSYYAGPPNYWNKEDIDQNILKANPAQVDSTFFDEDSIMLYQFPGYLIKGGKGTKNNTSLSEVDKSYISKKYPGNSATPVKVPKGNNNNATEKAFTVFHLNSSQVNQLETVLDKKINDWKKFANIAGITNEHELLELHETGSPTNYILRYLKNSPEGEDIKLNYLGSKLRESDLNEAASLVEKFENDLN